MTKFVGKFRKNKDYSDDYDFTRNNPHSKKRRDEQPEVKKLKNYEYVDSYELSDKEDWPNQY